MDKNICSLIIAIFIIASSGCASPKISRTIMVEDESRTIDNIAIEKVLENPSGPTLPINVGDNISIYTNKKIEVLSKDVSYVRLVVRQIDNRNIAGKIYAKDDTEENFIRVRLEDISQIKIWKTKTIKSPGPGQALTKSINAAIVLLVTLLALLAL